MHTLVQTPKTTRQAAPAKSTLLSRPHLEHGPEVSSTLHLHRTIENQAVLRPPQAKSDVIGAICNATTSAHFGQIPVSTDQTSRLQSSPQPATQPVPAAVQAKLIVGQANDPLEHEADHVAEQVMRMSATSPATSGVALQRKCAACEEREPGETLRAKQHDRGESSGTEAPAIVAEVLRSPGQPLDAQARAFFEPRFGRDFSQVRIHADVDDARSAQSIGARAYTVGRHIAFAEGQYSPDSDHGRHLIAHELTHTIQQGHARIKRRPTEIQQAITGLVDIPEEMSRYEERAGPVEQVVRRSTAWKGATVRETLSPAEIVFGTQGSPITWHLLNGTKLDTDAAADGAIKVPGVTTFPVPSTNPAATWVAKVDTVPAQEGSGDETVLGPGPWTKVVTKAQAGSVTGLAACAGAGNSTFTARGDPSDDAVYKANRRHEDHHLADHKVAFEDAIGEWDKKVQDAKNADTTFPGASPAAATAVLWTAMGNTPEKAARSYRAQGFAKGAAFHTIPAGGPMSLSNRVANANCSTSGADVKNPS